MAGSITYLAPVENASGKIFGKKEKFIAVRRLTGDRKRGCSVQGERTTKFSQDELARQDKFSAVTKSTRARMKDPSKVMADQAAYKAVQSQYKSFYQYVFRQEWNAYTE